LAQTNRDGTSAPAATKLSINLNKVALLRNQRSVGYPDVIAAARTVIVAGAHGITVHPRPDGRHIRESDVRALAALIRGEFSDRVEFNIEGNPFEPIYALCETIRPTQATLVPDAPDVSTSDAGWRLPAEQARLTPVIARLRALGIRVSLFVEPEAQVIRAARAAGADRIELYTGPYAAAFGTPRQDAVLATYVAAAESARELGLGVNAGHDLTMQNVAVFRRAIPWLAEVSIGHAFTSDALWLGFAKAVAGYLRALDNNGVDHARA
jgi:pyridoxine 5-phosphate synthase